jgi:hypothetical protein
MAGEGFQWRWRLKQTIERQLPRGPKAGGHRLSMTVDVVIDDVVHLWLPKQRHLAHPESKRHLKAASTTVARLFKVMSVTSSTCPWKLDHYSEQADVRL